MRMEYVVPVSILGAGLMVSVLGQVVSGTDLFAGGGAHCK